MNQLTIFTDLADQVNRLHTENEHLLRRGLQNAIDAGRILSDVKAKLPHGQFGNWCAENLAFSNRTARRYMKVYQNRDQLAGAADLTDAYRLLSEPKTDTLANLDAGDQVLQESDADRLAVDHLRELLQEIEHAGAAADLATVKKFVADADQLLRRVQERRLRTMRKINQLQQQGDQRQEFSRLEKNLLARIAELHGGIEQRAVETLQALETIEAKKLYREKYNTFDAYCLDNYGLSADQLKAAFSTSDLDKILQVFEHWK